MSIATIRDRLRTSLWFVPAGAVLVATVVAQMILSLDRRTDTGGWLVFGGGAESARVLLSAIATSVVTLTALVFSITIVVLQLASSQYSSRVLRTFLRNRMSKLALASFLATFTATMLVLRAVRGGDEIAAFVPQISVHAVLFMMLVCLGMFIAYIHHVANSMQASHVVANVADETAAVLRRLYPEAGEDQPEPAALPPTPHVVIADKSGYIQDVAEQKLLELATSADLVLRLQHQPGDFVAEGGTLFEISSPFDDEDALRKTVVLGPERTPMKDPAFGFRQLVDVAERALSPGINDSTTAVQALNRVHQLLVLLAPRKIPSATRSDSAGVARLHLPRPGWDDFVDLGFDTIRRNGKDSQQVRTRLDEILTDLASLVPASRRSVVARHRRLLDQADAAESAIRV